MIDEEQLEPLQEEIARKREALDKALRVHQEELLKSKSARVMALMAAEAVIVAQKDLNRAEDAFHKACADRQDI